MSTKNNEKHFAFANLTFARVVAFNRAMFPGLPDESARCENLVFLPQGRPGIIIRATPSYRVYCTHKETRYRGYRETEVSALTLRPGGEDGPRMTFSKQTDGRWHLALSFHPGDPMEADLYRWLALMCWDDARLRTLAKEVRTHMTFGEKAREAA